MGRASKSLSAWLIALAALSEACGKSKRSGGGATAGSGGASDGGRTQATSGGSHSAAGRDATSAGTAAGGRAASGGAGAGAGGHGGRNGSPEGGGAGRAAGGSVASGGIGGMESGAGGEGGAEAGAAGATSECAVGAPAQACNAVFDGYMPPVIDFTKYSSTGKWSSGKADGLTGTTSLYHSPAAPNLVLAVEGSSLHVTGTLPPMSYAGWVWAFDGCHDGSDNIGFRFPLMGDLGAAHLVMSILFNADFAIDPKSGRGACAFTQCETKSSECRPPSSEIPAANLASSTQFMGFSQFTGGAPEGSVTSPTELLGMQFELRCTQSSECVVDLTFGLVSYFSA